MILVNPSFTHSIRHLASVRIIALSVRLANSFSRLASRSLRRNASSSSTHLPPADARRRPSPAAVVAEEDQADDDRP